MTLKRFFRILHVGMECVLSAPFVNWFNPFLTLYLNFRSFPIKQAVKLPVFVYGWPKLFSLLGSMECKDVCKTGMVKLNQTNVGAPSNPGPNTAINNWGKIIFHGPCLIYTANKINTHRYGVLELGANTKIMHYVNITAHVQVFVGANTRITHRCQILDSNFHYVANFNKKTVGKYCKPIHIGSSCWICNSSTIAAGAKIPDCTIVASNSLVNKDFSSTPTESIIGGIPAKFVGSGFRRINNPKFDYEIGKYFGEHPEENEFPLDDEFDHELCD
jgi:acetyltransferase-like isoleucine patch superfamily enzyme